MAQGRQTVDVVLDGALRALLHRGRHRVTVSDVCREAGVSRGTLYRYFKNCEDVLEAVNERALRTNRQALEEAVRAEPALEVRVRVVLRAMLSLTAHYPHMAAVIAQEPRSVIRHQTRDMPRVLRDLDEYLRPALELAPPVLQGVVTVEDLLEMFYRLVTSTFVAPSPGSERLVERVSALWEFTAGRGAAQHVEPAAAAAGG